MWIVILRRTNWDKIFKKNSSIWSSGFRVVLSKAL